MVCRSQHSARARQIALTCESLSSRLRIRWRGARRGGYQRSESRAEALRVPPPPAWRAACEAAAASPSRSAQAGAFTRRENCLRHQCNSVDSVDIFQGSDLGPMTSPIGSNVEFTALTQATTLNCMYQALPVYGVRASKRFNFVVPRGAHPTRRIASCQRALHARRSYDGLMRTRVAAQCRRRRQGGRRDAAGERGRGPAPRLLAVRPGRCRRKQRRQQQRCRRRKEAPPHGGGWRQHAH